MPIRFSGTLVLETGNPGMVPGLPSVPPAATTTMTTAETLIKEGRVEESLAALEAQVRAAPGDFKLRVFLFQVLSVLGRWERASGQLEVAAKMNPDANIMAQVCRQAILGEGFRTDVFSGKRTPLLLGEPEPWVQKMIAALSLDGQGQTEGAASLRAEAMDEAPASPGSIKFTATATGPESAAFEWIADADPRLGPMLEAMVGGKYYWIPWNRIRAVRFDPPTDLRDIIWAHAEFLWTTGATGHGLVPVRYPRTTDNAREGALLMSRQTEWRADAAGTDLPVGQRLFATEFGEFGLLGIKTITIGEGEAEFPSDREAAANVKAAMQTLEQSGLGKGGGPPIVPGSAPPAGSGSNTHG